LNFKVVAGDIRREKRVKLPWGEPEPVKVGLVGLELYAMQDNPVLSCTTGW